MKKFWKIYFWIYLIFMVMLVLYYIYSGDIANFFPQHLNTKLMHLFTYIIMFIPIVVLHGLAYRKRYLHHIFWKVYFVLYFLRFIKGFAQVGEESIRISIFSPFQIITLIGLFIYSFRQNKLFGKAEKIEKPI